MLVRISAVFATIGCTVEKEHGASPLEIMFGYLKLCCATVARIFSDISESVVIVVVVISSNSTE